MLRKKIISLVCISMISSSVNGADVATTEKLLVVSDLNVKLGAYASFESGFSNQSKLMVK